MDGLVRRPARAGGGEGAEMSETKTERIIRLANSQEWSSRSCLARAAGTSRELVRQVINKAGISSVKRVYHPRAALCWPCPTCGSEVERSRQQKPWKHMPAHCRSCADKFCRRGHLRAGRTKKGYRYCKECERDWHQTVIASRICTDCGKVVPVTRNDDHQISNPNTTMKGERCQSCRNARGAETFRIYRQRATSGGAS